MTQRCFAAIPLFLLLVAGIAACSKSNLSERDLRLEQIRNNAEKKRKELKEVAHDYLGHLYPDIGEVQNLHIQFEIKDIPYQEEGQIDAVMVPALSGFLKLIIGSDTADPEYIAFSVNKAEYDANAKNISAVFFNEQYKNIISELHFDNGTLTGTWTAPELGSSGTLEVDKIAAGDEP